MWKSVLLEFMGFDFYVCVVVNGGDMIGLLVWGVEGKIADHGCDVRGDAVEVGG